MKWLPISEAPKDGTRVLLYRQGRAESMAVGHWSDFWDQWVMSGSSTTLVIGPTEWAPLPPPPGADDAG